MTDEELRHGYRACIKLAKETDSKREEAALVSEADVLLNALRERCAHELTVILESSYQGCHSMDYDDRRPGTRICLKCGIGEREYDADFKILVDPFVRFEGNAPEEVRHPLRYLLAEAVEGAARGYRP